MRSLPCIRTCKTVGFRFPVVLVPLQTRCRTSLEQVPTPSLKTRPLRSISGITVIASNGSVNELNVCEKACPIRAAHLAGERILVKSPKFLMTERAYIKDPRKTKGAMNQQVCSRNEEWENPRNFNRSESSSHSCNNMDRTS